MKSTTKKARVVIGLSGGVDSSVSAWLLKQQGYEVIGVFMKNWESDDTDQYCSSRQDWIDVVSIADKIGIEVETVNFAQMYRNRVFEIFLREYQAGRTPNPDVLCNSEIKFKAFLEYAYKLGADYVATGHYCRVEHVNNSTYLLRGVDPNKDQSYFLHQLTQEQLKNILFPVGGLLKKQVRTIAHDIGLHNAQKKDSTGICFIGERPFRDFLNQYLPTSPGPILSDNGHIIGQHIGLSFYTIGQRKGLGIGGQTHGDGSPWFVARKDIEKNHLYCVQGANHPWLMSQYLQTQPIHWINQSHFNYPNKLTAKIRYRQSDSACSILLNGDSCSNLSHIRFDSPQWAVTPGQYLVLYYGERCLGGAIIESASS